MSQEIEYYLRRTGRTPGSEPESEPWARLGYTRRGYYQYFSEKLK